MSSNVKRYAIFTGIAIVALLVVAYVFVLNESSEVESTLTEVEQSPTTVTSTQMTGVTKQPNFPPRKPQIAWTEITSDDSLPKSKWSRVPDHAIFVSLNGRFDQWLLNTPVEVHIPHVDTTYRAIVDEITPNGRHSTTIRASPASDENDLNRLILTYGQDQTLAYVSTKQGSWELTGDGQIGWLVSSAELKRSQDYSESDILNENFDRYAGAEYVPRRTE